MNVSSRLLIGALIPIMIGCAEAEPESTIFEGLISEPTFFDGSKSLTFKVKNNEDLIAVSGTCPMLAHHIEVSI